MPTWGASAVSKRGAWVDWITSNVRTVREVFAQGPFAVDLYQRDYTWSRDHASKLIEDFADAFAESRERRRRGLVPAPYFLGPLVFHRAKGTLQIVDGQQRLTTLLILMIRLSQELGGRPPGRELDGLIHPQGDPEKFAMAVDGYQRALASLERAAAFDAADATDPERALAERYADFDSIMPEEAAGPSVAAFSRWLLDEVVFAEIIARDENSAFQIFETMNNRGQPIRPSDLFRHYLLSRITDPTAREEASDSWRRESTALQAIAPGEDLVALRTVLQARYAVANSPETVEGSPGLHDWSPSAAIDNALGGAADFARFVSRDLVFYSRWYRKVKQAGSAYTPGLEALFFVARTGVPLAMRLMLASLSPADPDDVTVQKARIAAIFLDVVAARLAWTPKARRRRSLHVGLAAVVEEMRTRTPETLGLYLAAQASRLSPEFAETPDFGLGSARRADLHAILARLVSHVEHKVSGRDIYPQLEVRQGPLAWEVVELPDAMGSSVLAGLTLAPKDATARADGAGATAYGQLLTLGAAAETQIRAFNSGLDVPFVALNRGNAAALNDRQTAVLGLARRVWDPQRIIDAARVG